MAKNYLLKTVLSMLSFLLVSILPATGQIDYALNEGFESGNIPSEWTQEYEVGNVDWVIERDGEFPNGAAEGSYRVVLRNETQQTQGFETKLVSRIMDLTEVYQPILVFSHAQDQNLGDVDELRVYYRIAENSHWVLLEEYTERIRNWKTDTIRLVDPGATYQIAFEGKDKYGKGIVLDDIRVRPMPTCSIPQIQSGTEVTSTSFNLNWDGSFDTDSFAVRLSKTLWDDINEATDLVLDTMIIESFQCLIPNLDVNTTYYCYVKAYCLKEESAWSDVYSYKTQSTARPPHKETFDMAYNPSYGDKINTWTWKNSWIDAEEESFSPFINTNTNEVSKINFSRTATTCVSFSGGYNVETPVPARQWAYIASSEILVDDIREVKVSFWGTVYRYTNDNYASSLTVGVMTDPENINTFYPIDTVIIKEAQTFQEFEVTFEKYTGEGKFIAFMSRFDKDNIFFLDDVSVDYLGDCPRASEVQATYTLPTSAEIKWKESVKASGYNVVITSKSVTDPSNPGYDLVYRTSASSNVCQIPEGELTPFTRYYAYVQADCGNSKSSWSTEYTFLTPVKGKLPLYYTFEPEIDLVYKNADNKDISVGLYPKCSDRNNTPYNFSSDLHPTHKYEGDYTLFMEGNALCQSYVALPAVEDDFAGLRITFFASHEQRAVATPAYAYLEVGVMSHIDDYRTFIPIDIIELQADEFKYYELNLDEYQGDGKCVAIRMSDLNGTSKRYIYLDNIRIEEIPECRFPYQKTAEPGENSVKIDWESTGAGNEYRVILSLTPVTDFTDVESLDLVKDTIVDTNSCEIKGLLINNATYYYYIQSLCGVNEKSDWSVVESFNILCLSKGKLPYFEDFESYQGTDGIAEIPLCWETTFIKPNLVYYPSIRSDQAYSGGKSLFLNSSATASEKRSSYVILPEFEVELQELQVSFMYYAALLSHEFEVGVISDISDTATFVSLVTFKAPVNRTWYEGVVKFDTIQGEGKRIMIRSLPGATHSVYIDDVEVNYIDDCLKPQSLAVRDITDDSAVLYWDNGKDETEWNLMVLKKNVHPDNATSSDIQWEDVINQNPYTLTGLDENVQYWYYLQSICGDDTLDWTLTFCSFRTGCVPKTIEEMGVETFETSNTDFDCWETGILTGTSTVSLSSNNSSRRLYFNVTEAGDGVYAIMPEIDVDSIKDLQVTFNMYSVDPSLINKAAIIVGVITNSADMASFVPLDTVKVLALEDIERKFTVRFDKYKGDYRGNHGKRVMFMSSFGLEGSTNLVYIDNVYFDTIAACPEPTRIWLESIDVNDAKIQWNGTEESTYRVVVSPTPLTEQELNGDLSGKELIADRTVQGTEVEVSGLGMVVNYVYIQNICPEAQKRPWSNEWFFYSACPEVFPLPYVENFDIYGTGSTVLPACWNTYYGNGSTQPGGFPNCNATYDNSYNGKASLLMSTPNTADYYCMAVSPALEVDDISACRLSFDLLTTITYFTKIIVGVTNDPTNLTLGSYLPVDTISVWHGQPDPKTLTWYEYHYDLSYLSDVENIDSYKHVVFVIEWALNRQGPTTVVGYQGSYYLDNVTVELIEKCSKPTYVDYRTTHNSLIATWADNIGTSWNVQYGKKGFALGTGDIVTTDTQSAVVPDLEPDTDYGFYIQSVCESDEESNWAGPFSATTLCLVSPEDASFGFEEDEGFYYGFYSATNKLPACWILGNTTPAASYIPYNIKNTAITYSRTGDYALRMYVTSTYKNAYAIMPAVDADLDTMQVRFSARAVAVTASGVVNSSNNHSYSPDPHIFVGTISNPYDYNTFEEIQKVDLSKWVDNTPATAENNFLWDDIIVPLAGTEGKHVMLAVSYRDAGNKNYYTYVDDVVIEKETYCASVLDVYMHNYNYDVTTAELSWRILGSLNTKCAVIVSTEEIGVDTVANVNPAVLIYNQESTVPKALISNLLPSTTYYVYIKSICDDDESDWTIKEFTTPCPSVELPMEWTFEEPGGHPVEYNANLAPACWFTGMKVGGTTSYYAPVKFPDTGSNTYSHANGGAMGRSLRFNTNATNDGAYAIMPHFIGNMDTLQLRFHARATHHNNTFVEGQGYKIASNASGLRSIMVGTVSRLDISTFVPIETVQVTQLVNTQYANEGNNWLFDEIVIPLSGVEGNYIAFLAEFEAANLIYIDDVSIEKLDACLMPINPVIDSITSNTADISWQLNGNTGLQWVVLTATDAEMTEIESEETVSVYGKHTIEGLSPDTKYYVAVKQICQEGVESNWSKVVEFTTARTVVFHETFAGEARSPEGWIRIDKKFTPNTDIMLAGEFGDINPNLNTGWLRTTSGYGLPTAHQSIRINNTKNYWLITPAVHLTDGQAKTWLTFDLAYTLYNSPLPISGDNLTGFDDRFVVIISDDGGASWNLANATEWNNQGSAYVLNEVSATGEQVSIDLSRYAGKTIKVGFYVESTVANTNNELHLDNVHINRLVELNLDETLCGGYDYVDNGFDILYTDLREGENYFERLRLSDNNAVADSIVRLTLTMTDLKTHTESDIICEGETYEGFGFKAINKEGVYKQKLKCTNSDCDSVVILNLTATPAIRDTISETICYGQNYYFNDKVYNRTGIYADTLPSKVIGCDSITTLQLRVLDIQREQVYKTICFDSIYDFNGLKLHESGTYIDTITANDCSLEVTLHLVVKEKLITYIDEYTCPGVPFTGHGFSGVPARTGIYDRSELTDDVCDSTIVLRLTVLDSDTVWLEETIMQSELPYPYYGTLYEKGTPVGTYSDTTLVTSGDGECQSLRIAILTIIEDDNPGTDLWTPTAIDELSIIPTIIERGQSVWIFYDMSTVTGLKVEVYDMTGRCIHTQHPTVEPIEINAFPSSGMYLIRAISSKGDVRHGRVIVK